MFKSMRKFFPFWRHTSSTTSIWPIQLELGCLRIPLLCVKSISTTPNQPSFAAIYLINNCGFSPERAASVSKYLHFETREQPDLVMKFLENQGFSQAQALKAIGTVPRVLRIDPERILLPKIEFLKSKGVLSSDIPRIILTDPNILLRSLENILVPSFDFLSSLLQSDEKFVKALKRFSGILVHLNVSVIPNIRVLRAEGVPESHITKLLEFQPRTLCRTPHQFKSFVEEVKEMGFNPQQFKFVQAILTLTCISKCTWARKSGALKRWGWSDDDILAAFRRYPNYMTLSENNIEAKLEYFVKKLGCKSSCIARHPDLLSLSLDKRIIPRGSFFQALLSKGLVSKLSLTTMFQSSERVFMKRYILRHEKEAGELLKLYYAKLELPR